MQYPAQATTLQKFHATEWFVAPTAFVIATVKLDTDASAMVLVAGLALQPVRLDKLVTPFKSYDVVCNTCAHTLYRPQMEQIILTQSSQDES